MTRRLTQILMCFVFFFLIGYDIFAAYMGGEYTITARVREISHLYPIIPFTFGFVLGPWVRNAK